MIREFKGWHMAAIVGLFFATVIVANLTMAFMAARSWPGLVVKNSYVASQAFNADLAIARKQHEAGWTMTAEGEDESVIFRFADQGLAPLSGLTVRATLRRPATEAADMDLTLMERRPGVYYPESTVPKGVWIADVTVEVAARGPMRFVQRVMVR